MSTTTTTTTTTRRLQTRAQMGAVKRKDRGWMERIAKQGISIWKRVKKRSTRERERGERERGKALL